MSWNNKVVWSEGMFLRPQHFQQADRYLEALVRGRVDGLRSHSWGFTELAINHDLLKTGQFAVASCRGVLPDGTPFSIPEDADHPPPLEIPQDIRTCVVYLTLPIRQPGRRETALTPGAEVGARYRAGSYEAVDSNFGSDGSFDVRVGRMAFRYALETSDRAGYICLGVARISEVRADRSIVLEEGYIPACLQSRASALLAGYLTELQGLFAHRVEALAGRLATVTADSAKGASEVSDFLLLTLVNRYAPLFEHYAAFAAIHPEDFFAEAVAAAGELATFTAKTRRPPRFPVYQHEDLQRTFLPVMTSLRESLSAVIPSNAVRIDLQKRGSGIWLGVIKDRGLLTGWSFVLAAKAQVPREQLRVALPRQIKVGSAENIRSLVNSALTGIPVSALLVAPRQVPFRGDTAYFELDRTSDYWAELNKTGGLAIHLSGEFPNVELECWAIKE